MTLSKKESSEASDPDDILENIGGCGRFQVRISIIIHLIKTVTCFAFVNLLIWTKVYPWSCDDGLNLNGNQTLCTNESTKGCSLEKSCVNYNNTKCHDYQFDDNYNGLVNEFELVCEYDYIPSTLASIQVFGTLVGNFVGGQLADLLGRKLPFFVSIFIMISMHIVGYFSTSWQMFAVSTFFTGVGGGFFLTTQYCILAEFTLSKWRSWIVGFPSWPIQTCVYCLCAWLIHDWRYLQLMTALMAVPCLLAWFWIPESFRWYLAHDKTAKAESIVRYIAKTNGKNESDILNKLQSGTTNEEGKYTVLHLFKSRDLTKTTILLMLVWGSMGIATYGIGYGIQTLSGNIYFNTFLFALFSIPTKSIAIFLQNRFGRRKASILCFSVVAASSLTIGVVQTLNLEHKDSITNVLAILANTGIATSWGPVQTMALELYPTVIRNIGFGTLSVVTRLGAIAGPQLVYINTYVAGLLFYICGSISLLCVIALLFLRETMDQHLEDKLSAHKSEFSYEANVDISDEKM